VTVTGRNVKRKRGRRESAEGEERSDGGQTKLTLTGDRREVEAMALELRRLAKEHGLEFRNMQIQPADEKP
jgi:hypothetical protein